MSNSTNNNKKEIQTYIEFHDLEKSHISIENILINLEKIPNTPIKFQIFEIKDLVSGYNIRLSDTFENSLKFSSFCKINQDIVEFVLKTPENYLETKDKKYQSKIIGIIENFERNLNSYLIRVIYIENISDNYQNQEKYLLLKKEDVLYENRLNESNLTSFFGIIEKDINFQNLKFQQQQQQQQNESIYFNLNYITNSLKWNLFYIFKLNDNFDKLQINTYLSVNNNSFQTYKNINFNIIFDYFQSETVKFNELQSKNFKNDGSSYSGFSYQIPNSSDRFNLNELFENNHEKKISIYPMKNNNYLLDVSNYSCNVFDVFDIDTQELYSILKFQTKKNILPIEFEVYHADKLLQNSKIQSKTLLLNSNVELKLRARPLLEIKIVKKISEFDKKTYKKIIIALGVLNKWNNNNNLKRELHVINNMNYLYEQETKPDEFVEGFVKNLDFIVFNFKKKQPLNFFDIQNNNIQYESVLDITSFNIDDNDNQNKLINSKSKSEIHNSNNNYKQFITSFLKQNE